MFYEVSAFIAWHFDFVFGKIVVWPYMMWPIYLKCVFKD
jgi:hypothetical protein